VQAHFEDSQFENNRQDGKRPLKWNAVPTLFNIPNKPQPVTVRRVNPLDRKRPAEASATATVGACESSSSLAKVPRTDHIYCRIGSRQRDFQSVSTSDSDHTYSAYQGCITSSRSNGKLLQLVLKKIHYLKYSEVDL